MQNKNKVSRQKWIRCRELKNSSNIFLNARKQVCTNKSEYILGRNAEYTNK